MVNLILIVESIRSIATHTKGEDTTKLHIPSLIAVGVAFRELQSEREILIFLLEEESRSGLNGGLTGHLIDSHQIRTVLVLFLDKETFQSGSSAIRGS